MSNTAVGPRPLNNLTGMVFEIPSYQRGYRWREREVTALLKDLQEALKDHDTDGTYCLQPLIVMKTRTQGNPQVYSVIDGQQRLTTLFLILRQLTQEVEPSASAPLQIQYATRETKLNWTCTQDACTGETVDAFLIQQAATIIQGWFAKPGDTAPPLTKEWLLKRVSFIWYELQPHKSMSPEEVFLHFNSGRIPLTTAEIHKAKFFLNAMARSKDDPRRTADEMAFEWEQMETSLRDEEFWSFLHPTKEDQDHPNRISLLLSLAKPNRHSISEWLKLCETFALLRGWFEDRETYRAVGFLLSIGKSGLHKLVNDAKGKTKYEFLMRLEAMVSEALKSNCPIGELQYAEHDQKIIHTLLWFNILSTEPNARFSFRAYAAEHWSLEHIHAQKSERLDTKKTWESRLSVAKNAIELLSEERASDLNSLIEKAEEKGKYMHTENGTPDGSVMNQLEQLLQQIEAAFTKSDSLHQLGNLALLSKSHNSALSNAVFLHKRDKIIEMEGTGEWFLPATRNVFLKYYTKSSRQHQPWYWSKDDQDDYVEAITAKLKAWRAEA